MGAYYRPKIVGTLWKVIPPVVVDAQNRHRRWLDFSPGITDAHFLIHQ